MVMAIVDKSCEDPSRGRRTPPPRGLRSKRPIHPRSTGGSSRGDPPAECRIIAQDDVTEPLAGQSEQHTHQENGTNRNLRSRLMLTVTADHCVQFSPVQGPTLRFYCMIPSSESDSEACPPRPTPKNYSKRTSTRRGSPEATNPLFRERRNALACDFPAMDGQAVVGVN